MHVQIVTFSLKDMSEAELRALSDQAVPALEQIPGLISKIMLFNPATNSYGGVYTWESREAMERFLQSALFAGVAANPSFANVTSTDYSAYRVIDGPAHSATGRAAQSVGVV